MVCVCVCLWWWCLCMYMCVCVCVCARAFLCVYRCAVQFQFTTVPPIHHPLHTDLGPALERNVSICGVPRAPTRVTQATSCRGRLSYDVKNPTPLLLMSSGLLLSHLVRVGWNQPNCWDLTRGWNSWCLTLTDFAKGERQIIRWQTTIWFTVHVTSHFNLLERKKKVQRRWKAHFQEGRALWQ